MLSAMRQDLQESFDLLQAAMAKTPKLAPHTIGSVRYALKGSKVDAGQGPDHQVLKHWANLPGEAIRLLLLIIYQMEAGSLPTQAFMVYISRIPKPAGGGEAIEVC